MTLSQYCYTTEIATKEPITNRYRTVIISLEDKRRQKQD